jgi:flavin reductase (DIM6/NTAB) family NADH-FMN oxidoreductase RutF
MPDSQTFRQAWGKFATGVSVVTTVQEDGSVHGMTANGISSVSLDPPLVLVCVGHTAASYPLIREAKRFAINIMNEDQRPLAEYYARPSDQKTGELDVSFTHTERGVATVDGSLAHMDCRVVSEHEAGDHTIFIAEVEEIEIGDGKPLLYYEGRFSSLANGSQD